MQPLVQAERPSFSWRKGLLHAAAVAAQFVVLGRIALAFVPFQAIQVQILSTLVEWGFWATLLALAASYAWQTRRAILGGFVLLLAVALVLGVLRSIRTAARSAGEAPLTAAERERPARDASHSRLCQAALGFSFPDPGPPYGPEAAAEAKLAAKLQTTGAPDTIKAWVWKGSGAGAIIVEAFKGTGGTEAGFRQLAATVEAGITRTVRLSPQEKSFRWSSDGGELTFTGTSFDNRVQVHFRCLSRGREGSLPPLAVCLQTYTGKDGDPLRKVRDGLAVTACGGG